MQDLLRIIDAIRGDEQAPGRFTYLRSQAGETAAERATRKRAVAAASKPYIETLQRVEKRIIERLTYIYGARNADGTTTRVQPNGVPCERANIQWVANYMNGPRVDCDGTEIEGNDDDYLGGDDDDDNADGRGGGGGGGGDDGGDNGGDDGGGGGPRRRQRSPARRLSEPASLLRSNGGGRPRRSPARVRIDALQSIDEIVDFYKARISTR
jgi:uncharacterized membrane protein YgcG